MIDDSEEEKCCCGFNWHIGCCIKTIAQFDAYYGRPDPMPGFVCELKFADGLEQKTDDAD